MTDPNAARYVSNGYKTARGERADDLTVPQTWQDDATASYGTPSDPEEH